MWSDSDHDVVIAHYSNSDFSEGDAGDPDENSHINIYQFAKQDQDVIFLFSIILW